MSALRITSSDTAVYGHVVTSQSVTRATKTAEVEWERMARKTHRQTFIQTVQMLHFIIRELEVINLSVRYDPLFGGCFGNRNETLSYNVNPYPVVHSYDAAPSVWNISIALGQRSCCTSQLG